MSRPDSVTNEDLARWDASLEVESDIPKVFLDNPITKEVCRSGLYLAEKLKELNCPDEIITRIQFTCGRMSFGRNPWDMATLLLKAYEDGTLTMADDDTQTIS